MTTRRVHSIDQVSGARLATATSAIPLIGVCRTWAAVGFDVVRSLGATGLDVVRSRAGTWLSVGRSWASTGFGLLGMVLLSMAILAGCSDDDPTTEPEPEPEPSPYLAQTSPENVLTNLRTALELRDPEGVLDQLLAPEFRFVTSPLDVAERPDLPRHWGYDCEADLLEGMLNSSALLDLRLDFILGSVEEPHPEDEAGDVSWRRMLVTQVELEVELVNPADPTDNIIYRVPGDGAVFLFARDENDVVDGAPAWKIVEWRDVHPLGGGAGPRTTRASRTGPGGVGAATTQEHTVGGVKALFSSSQLCATLQPTNPRFVLENLEDAYNQRDLGRFTDLFVADGYVFSFDPADTGDPRIPERWGWAEEEAAHATLFDSPQTQSVELGFLRSPVTSGGVTSIAAENVQLNVVSGEAPPVEFVVDGGRAVFTCAPDPIESAFGHPLWKIVAWSDEQADPLAAVPMSWGRLKHAFYLEEDVGDPGPPRRVALR